MQNIGSDLRFAMIADTTMPEVALWEVIVGPNPEGRFSFAG